MKKDKGLDLFLVVVFGVGGVTILVVGWLQPMLLPERLLTTFIGTVGPCWTGIRLLVHRSAKGEKRELVPAEVHTQDGK